MQLNCYFRSGSCTTGMTNRWARITDSTKTRSRSAIGNFLLAMRVTAMIILVASLSVSAKGVSQNVTFSGRDVSLEKVLDEVKKQTGLKILYTEDVFTAAKPISIEAVNLPVEDFVALVLKNQAVKFIVENRTIFISKKGSPAADLSPRLPLEAPPIKGIIRDAEGNPLQGINIVVKGTKRGVVTDGYGNFTIDANINDVLIISSINYGTKQIKIVDLNTPLIVALEKSVSQLDEVQYIAYGTTSKRFTTSNMATVTSKEIEQQPVNNPLLALQGRVPGVEVIQSNGIPGSGLTIRIQGRNNLDNKLVGSDPLIVIDGVPYQSQNLSTFFGGASSTTPILGSSSDDGFTNRNSSAQKDFGNPLSYINPLDIESITVLKDADATAIYGSRAANGALLITTQKGKAGQMKVNFNLQQGWGKVAHKMDLLNSQQYMEMRREAKLNDNDPIKITDYDLRGVWDTSNYTDWQKVLIGGTAEYSRITAGISGGTANIQYLVSGTYGKETTVFPGDFSNTFGSLHFNISASSANQRFKMQLGGSFMAGKNSLPAEDFTNYALNMPSIAPFLYNADGSLNWAPDTLQGGISTWYNPLSKQQYIFETKPNNLLSNGSFSYRIIPGLELKSTFGFTSTTSDQFSTALDETEKPEYRLSRVRSAVFSFNTSKNLIIEPQLSFQQNWSNHKLALLVGTTFQYLNSEGRRFSVSGQSSDIVLRNMAAGTNISASAPDVSEYRYNAVFGRVNYSFKEKYLINLACRRDGSSRFGPNNRFSNFGSVGAGWILSEEEFLKSIAPFVSYAKIRGSYGITGNDQFGNYQYLNLYTLVAGGIPYQEAGSSRAQGLPNPNLEWEETRKLQIGIDLGLFKDRIQFTANYIRNRSSNSLTSLPTPISTGFNTFIQNLPALIQNTGWEFSISSININSGNIRWSTGINLTIPQNKLLNFPGLATSSLKYLTIGQSLNSFKTYPFYGIDSLTGNYLIKDIHGNPTSTPSVNDATVVVNTSSRWYGGIQNSITYKRLSLDFLIQFTKQYGIDIFQLSNPGYFYPDNPSNVIGNQTVIVMERWQKPGDVSIIQRFSSTASNAGYTSGDLTQNKDISFARLKNVSLAYQLAQSLLQKLRMRQMRLYANAQNLLTITRYHGLDPESRSLNSLPPLRMITVGIQVGL